MVRALLKNRGSDSDSTFYLTTRTSRYLRASNGLSSTGQRREGRIKHVLSSATWKGGRGDYATADLSISSTQNGPLSFQMVGVVSQAILSQQKAKRMSEPETEITHFRVVCSQKPEPEFREVQGFFPPSEKLKKTGETMRGEKTLHKIFSCSNYF